MTEDENNIDSSRQVGGEGGGGGVQPNEEEEELNEISIVNDTCSGSGENVDGGGDGTDIIANADDASDDSDSETPKNNEMNSHGSDDEAAATAASTKIINDKDIIDDSDQKEDKRSFVQDDVVGNEQSESDEELQKNASSISDNERAALILNSSSSSSSSSQMATTMEGESLKKESNDQPQSQAQEKMMNMVNKANDDMCSLLMQYVPSPSATPSCRLAPPPPPEEDNSPQPTPIPPSQPPTLYEETKEMMEIATFMFFISKMRILARANKLYLNDEKTDTKEVKKGKKKKVKTVYSKQQDILGDQFTIRSVIDAINACSDKITEIEGFLSDGTPRTKFNVDLMESIRSRVGGDDERFFEINHFDDIRENEEIVPAIVVDHHRRRIIVTFRGSESKNDWVVNFSFTQVRVKNPVRVMTEQMSKDNLRKSLIGTHRLRQLRVCNQSKMLNLHNGFYNSIFDESSHFGLGNKYDDIKKKVFVELERNPGYTIGVTGFSLGGALCQVFTLHFASETDPRIPKPVTCFSYASPRVGSVTYRRAIQSLEELGMLRLFRVSNHSDYIPILPRDPITTFGYSCLPIIPLNIICRQGKFYRKAGLEMKLLDDGGIAMTHPKMPKGVNWGLYANLLLYDIGATWKRQKQCCGCAFKILTFDRGLVEWRDAHSYVIYYDKIIARRKLIEAYSLEDLYASSRDCKKSFREIIC